MSEHTMGARVIPLPARHHDDDPAAGTAPVLTGEVLPAETAPRPRPVLPVWLCSRDALRTRIREAARTVTFHAVRSPLHALRLVWVAGRGAARVLRRVAVWVSAPEHRAVVEAARRALDAAPPESGEDAAVRLVAARKAWSAERGVRARVAAGVGVGVLLAGGLVVLLAPPLAIAGTAAGTVGALALAGRGRDRGMLPAAPAAPITPETVPDADGGSDAVLDTAAIREACRVGGLGAVRVIGAPARDRSGTVEATVALVELPPGGVAKRVLHKGPEIASALSSTLAPEQVALDEVPGQVGRLRLWVADDDPYGPAARTPRPVQLDAERMDAWSPLPVAYTPRGGTVSVRVGADMAGLLVGGEPGGGKSAACNTLLASLFLDPTVRVVMADGKGIDTREWWELCESVTTADPDGLCDQVDDLLAEHERRAGVLAELGEKKVTRDVAAAHPDARLHMTVLYIDELAFYLADKAAWRERAVGDGGKTKLRSLGESLRLLVSLCRATGIRVIAATQKPEDDVIPSKLRDMFSGRWALRCTSAQMSNTVLGSGLAGQGADASTIRTDHRGAGYLKDETGRPVRCRSFYLDPDRGDLDSVVARARALREAAGTMPVRDWPPRILADLADAIGAARGAHTATLLPLLQAAGHDLPDAESLAAALRPYGVRPGDVHVPGVGTRKGYRAADVAAAIRSGAPAPMGPRTGR